jgi:hypothetical protein
MIQLEGIASKVSRPLYFVPSEDEEPVLPTLRSVVELNDEDPQTHSLA